MDFLKQIGLDLAVGSGLIAAYHFLFVKSKCDSYDAYMTQLKDAGIVSQGEDKKIANAKALYLSRMKDKIATAKASMQASEKPAEIVKAYKGGEPQESKE